MMYTIYLEPLYSLNNFVKNTSRGKPFSLFVKIFYFYLVNLRYLYCIFQYENFLHSVSQCHCQCSKPMLGIHDTLVWIRIPGSVTLKNGSGPAPDPTPDPTPFFTDFKDAKKYFFIFFLITCPQAHHLQSAPHIYEKKEGSGARSGSIPPTNGSRSGRPKNMRIRIPNTARNYAKKTIQSTFEFQKDSFYPDIQTKIMNLFERISSPLFIT